MNQLNTYLKVAPHAAEAIAAGKPVVALESTIISHGMPYPKNVETALQVEETVRANGAIPATIALLDGKIVVGLDRDEIEALGKAGLSVTKTSRRDMPIVLAEKKMGATTVAATMIAANLAGIPIFATGGIGGVHRKGEQTLDISADLEELAVTPVMVVCSGAKSILDIGRTLEYLETKGVPVVGYETDEMPAFYTRKSGFPLTIRLDDPEKTAEAFRIKRALGLSGGMVIANPVPADAEMDPDLINQTITEALADADRKGITGKDITPFLLDRIQRQTSGRSLETNIRLVLSNAALAARIAVALSRRP
ncbi:MAG TPA: pseudouridine-5'-phosphate glycosidase [Clostridiaceae bacterium]|nr:pseudouridine-5'-phosphate glycosidase [Clostridiaceae bacterium]